MTIFENLMRTDSPTTSEPQSVLLTFLLAFIIGQVIGWVYQKTHRGLSYSQSFTASMVVLPVLVAMMMLLMQNNVTIAFGLLAVFAVVRFRNVLKDTRDTIFILWAIVEGMSVGTGRPVLAILGSLVVGAIMFYLAVSRYGARSHFDTIVNLLFSDDANGEGGENAGALIAKVLGRHSLDVQLSSMQQVAPDQLDASYRLTLRDPARRSDLESELRSLPRVLRVAVFIHEDESEA